MTYPMTTYRRQRRSAFTLVELLFVIAIITVLTSLAYGVMREADDDARVSATRSRIAQIESIMQLVIEDYEVRRLPVRNSELVGFVRSNRIVDTDSGNDIPTSVQLRNLRRRILLDLLKAEFPTAFLDNMGTPADRSDDVLVPNPDLGRFPTETPVANEMTLDPTIDTPFNTWLASNYSNPTPMALIDLLRGRATAELTYWEGRNNAANPTTNNSNLDQPGEYLHLQLARIDVDGNSALELLGSRAVGDPDGDGLPDIVDAFGESMGLQILQVRPMGDSDDIASDRWAFVATDINRRGPDGLPSGYQFASSVVPSPISTVRFRVVSQVLEQRGEQ